MQVTLKKAASLAAALSTIQVAIPTAVAMSIYDDNISPADLIQVATADQTAKIDKALSQIDALYLIRGLIGLANEGEINSLLTTRAKLDRQLQILNAIPFPAQEPNPTAIERQLDAMRASTEGPYSSKKETLQVAFQPGSSHSSLIKALKKQRIGVEDRLAGLNFGTTITLPDDVVAILAENDLI